MPHDDERPTQDEDLAPVGEQLTAEDLPDVDPDEVDERPAADPALADELDSIRAVGEGRRGDRAPGAEPV